MHKSSGILPIKSDASVGKPLILATALHMHDLQTSLHHMRILLLALILSSPAAADLLPTYSFFYSCASTLVDCGAFPIHSYFAADQLPNNHPAGEKDSVDRWNTHYVASNIHGEAIGSYDSPFVSGAPVYAVAGGEVNCIPFLCLDGGYRPVDINNNGIYIINTTDTAPIMGKGLIPFIHPLDPFLVFSEIFFSQEASDQETSGGIGPTITALGINDLDQVLVEGRIAFSDGTEILRTGVFSPFVVTPEPGSALLMLTATCLLGLRLRRR